MTICRNGIYFIFSGKFLPYSEIDAGKYKTLTTQYIDSWFHIQRHQRSILGPPDLTKAHFDSRARFKNIHANWVCKACNCTKLYHNDTQCPMKGNPRYELQCAICSKTQNPNERKRLHKQLVDEQTKKNKNENGDEELYSIFGNAFEDSDDDSDDSDDSDEDDDVGDDDEMYCACKDPADGRPFFQCYNVDIRKHLRSIETPYIDGIIEHQWGHLDDYDEIYYWFFVLLGRWLFPLTAEWDDWQKLLCIFGNAGTGKSCILQLLKVFLPPTMFAPLSMNAQASFG